MSTRTPRSLALVAAMIVAVAGACDVDSGVASSPPPAAYPSGPYGVAIGDVLPDLAFDGVDAQGAPTKIHLHDYLEAEDALPHLLVVQVSGGLWCGTCRWYGAHAGGLAALGAERGLRRLDVVVGSRDNTPATAADAAAWQATFPADGVAVVADPRFELGGAQVGPVLPLFVLVDTGTMRVVDALANPAPDELRHAVEVALAARAGEVPPDAPGEALVDGLFHRNEWDLLSEITLPSAPPDDPTNAVADDPRAAALGEALFFDAGLSPSGQVSCATCHDPAHALADARPRGEGVGPGQRRTPPIALSAHSRFQFWDGRADSLWAQALGPFENPAEFGSSRVFVVRRIVDAHADAFRTAFPDEPLPDLASWPTSGRPGDAAYDAMDAGDRERATRIFVDVGKAIAAYERTFRVTPNALDAYVAGARDALTPDEKYGLQLFVRQGCMQCHWGPRLTDDAFHDTRVPTGGGDPADRGRIDGFAAWQSSEFRASGRFSDMPRESAVLPVSTEGMLGQFKTPPLRGVADLAHWGHGGAFDALAGVTESYGRGGVAPGDPASAGRRDPWLPEFGETAQWGLVPFLRTLTATPLVP
ncbi:MAG: cytochrome c peroxidase [Polyangiaceae bacterium]